MLSLVLLCAILAQQSDEALPASGLTDDLIESAVTRFIRNNSDAGAASELAALLGARGDSIGAVTFRSEIRSRVRRFSARLDCRARVTTGASAVQLARTLYVGATTS